MHKNVWRPGSTRPGFAGGAYSAAPHPLAGFKGSLRGRERQRRQDRERTNGKESRDHPLYHQFLDPPMAWSIKLIDDMSTRDESSVG